MKHASLVTIALGLVLSTSVFASASSAIGNAESALKSASQLGYEWRDTAKLIKKAKKQAKAGKTKEAEALAKMAEKQSLDAIDQYKRELKRYNH